MYLPNPFNVFLDSRPLVAACWTLVLLDVLSPGRSDLNTLAMKPSLTYVTADPELVICIVLSTCSAKSQRFLLVVLFFTTLFVIFRLLHLGCLWLRLRLFGLLKQQHRQRIINVYKNPITWDQYSHLDTILLLLCSHLNPGEMKIIHVYYRQLRETQCEFLRQYHQVLCS